MTMLHAERTFLSIADFNLLIARTNPYVAQWHSQIRYVADWTRNPSFNSLQDWVHV